MNTSGEATSERRFRTRTWGALVDANPVLAKELLVTARTPAFVAAMVLAPLALWALVLLFAGGRNRYEPATGQYLFPIYFSGLTIALGTLGAALGSTVVVQEREAGALDALRFSILRPASIVLGKLAAVVLAEVAVALCTLPLLVFILTQGGVSLGEMGVAMAIALACGLMTASLGVAVSVQVANARRALLASLLVGSAVGIGLFIWLVIGSNLGPWETPFGIARTYFTERRDGAYIATLFVFPAYALTTVLWLGHAAATSGLMDPSEDRSLPIKRWTLGAYAMGAIALVACSGWVPARLRAPMVSGSMVAIALLAAALLFVFAGEPARPTRRMQVCLRSPVVRALFPSCLAPSILFVVVASGIVLVSVAAIAGASDAFMIDALWAAACLSTLGGSIGSIAALRGATSARRAGAIAVVGLTFLVVLLRIGSTGPTWADAICPLGLEAEAATSAPQILMGGIALWLAAPCVSLGVMLVAVQFAPTPRRPKSNDTEPTGGLRAIS